MRKVFVTVIVAISICCVGSYAFGLTVIAKSVSSGTYEDGKFTAKDDSFQARYYIDEFGKKIVLEKVMENNREGKIDMGVEYEITNIVVSEGLSALLVSRDKKGQKIITAVREGDLGASETIVIGKDFYQFCRANNGKFYLEYGEIEILVN